MQIKRMSFLIAIAQIPGALADPVATSELEEVEVRGTRLEAPRAVGAYTVDGASLARMRASSSDTAKMLQNIPGRFSGWRGA